MTPFPEVVSFTVTNSCNLSCRMCGQWGPTGYMKDGKKLSTMPVSRWIELINEAARKGAKVVCLRGGEPLLFPGIMDVIRAVQAGGMFLVMDTNGVYLAKYADELAASGMGVVNVSVDGPEEVHDRVRGVPGTFQAMAEGVRILKEAIVRRNSPTAIGACFTISPDSLPGLASMGDVMRQLGIPTLSVNPYYYFPESTGRDYEKIMRESLGCEAYSWRGFHRENSGVDPDDFIRILREFKSKLGDVKLYPFMDFSDAEYRIWFSDTTTPVGRTGCTNPFKLLDIQPGGDANFCVDFPDYVIGNVAKRSLLEVWDSPRADIFRRVIASGPLPICLHCGAKYMSG